MEEVRPEKRKRVVQACSTCQTKKIRCDGKQPACSYCLNHNLQCVFIRSHKRRGPRKSVNENLEERLVRMEMLLDGSRMAPHSASSTSPPVSEIRLDEGPNSQAVDAYTPGSSRLLSIGETVSIMKDITPNCRRQSLSELKAQERLAGETRTETSNEMEYSPPVHWIIEKANDTSAINGALSDAFEPLRAVSGSNILPSEPKWPVYGQLPHKEEVLRLVGIFFHSYNRFIPLFDPPSFMALVERQFSGDPDNRVGWWASLNSVIAIAILLQGPDLGVKDAIGEARGYVHNAFGVLTELTMRSPDLLSVQALLSLAVLMQGNGDPQATAMLVTFALRLLNILHIHRRPVINDPVIIRQTRRAFWIACTMDSELSMVLRLPLIQSAEEVSVELPEEDPPDGLGVVSHSEGNGKVNLFRLFAELSIIEAEVHQSLYTSAAARKSKEERVQLIINLDQQLEEWKCSVPLDFQPEYEIKTTDFHLRQYIIALHFNYYTCLSNIHHACSFFGKLIQPSTKVASQVISSRAMYLSAARSTIRLTRYISKDTPAFVWRIMCYPILATITLLVSIRDDPHQPRALSDVTLLGSVVNFLSKMEDVGISTINQVRRVCVEFERVARDAVDKAQIGPKRQKYPINLANLGREGNQNNQSSQVNQNNQGDQSNQGTDRLPPLPNGISNQNEDSIVVAKTASDSTSTETERLPTLLNYDNFGDNLMNGYNMDQEAIFWNSENLHDNLLAEFLPQYYGQLEIPLGIQ